MHDEPGPVARLLKIAPLPVGGLLFTLAALAAHAPDGQCTAAFAPDTVRIQSPPVTIGYTLPEPVGTVTDVLPDEGSGIVVGVHDPDARTIQLHTQSAVSGPWSIALTADSAGTTVTCAGPLLVLGPMTAR